MRECSTDSPRGFPDAFGEFSWTDIFQEVGERSRSKRRKNALIFGVGGEDHDLSSRADPLHLAGRFHAVHARQRQVQQHHIGNQFLHHRERYHSVNQR